MKRGLGQLGQRSEESYIGYGTAHNLWVKKIIYYIMKNVVKYLKYIFQNIQANRICNLRLDFLKILIIVSQSMQ